MHNDPSGPTLRQSQSFKSVSSSLLVPLTSLDTASDAPTPRTLPSFLSLTWKGYSEPGAGETGKSTAEIRSKCEKGPKVPGKGGGHT